MNLIHVTTCVVSKLTEGHVLDDKIWSLCSHYGCNSNKCDGKINVSNAPPQMLTECVVGSLPCANAVGCGNPRVFAKKQQQQHLIVLKD